MKKFYQIILSMTLILGMFVAIPFLSQSIHIQAEDATYTAEEIVNFAKQQYGKPYVFGAAGPHAFDCTGFVKYVYNYFGIAAPRGPEGYESTTYKNYGTKVAIADLEPGDIVLYGTSAYNVTHAAIYVGDGLIINALNPSYGVYYNYVNHAAVYQYPGHNTFALSEPALFGIRPYGRIANMGTKVDLGHSFTAEIVDVSTSRLVTASSSSVILAKKSEARGTTQKWLFTRTTDNSYHIQCVSNNRALDVTGGYLKEGTAIKNVKLNTSLKRQKFYVQRLSDGTYVLRPMISQEKVFSLVDKKGVLSSYTKKSGQRFKIVKKDQISVKYSANGGIGSVGTTLMNFGKTLTLKSKGNIQRPGYEFRGWFAYREADKKYYCGSTHKWQTSAAIEKYGYKRTVFKAGAKYPIGYSWVNTKYGLQTLVMKAAWKKL